MSGIHPHYLNNAQLTYRIREQYPNLPPLLESAVQRLEAKGDSFPFHMHFDPSAKNIAPASPPAVHNNLHLPLHAATEQNT